MNLKSTIIGGTLLVVLLTAGAAQSLSGSNTVYADDIVNETITTSDVRNESLIGADIRTALSPAPTSTKRL